MGRPNMCATRWDTQTGRGLGGFEFTTHDGVATARCGAPVDAERC